MYMWHEQNWNAGILYKDGEILFALLVHLSIVKMY